MAKIKEDFIVLKISKLFKDDDKKELNVLTDDIKQLLSDAVEQLVNDDSCLIEIIDEDGDKE